VADRLTTMTPEEAAVVSAMLKGYQNLEEMMAEWCEGTVRIPGLMRHVFNETTTDIIEGMRGVKE